MTSDANYITFREVRYMTAAAFKGKPHEFLGLEVVICSTPKITGVVVGIDLMRQVVLFQYTTPYDPDDGAPVYSIMTFDGVRLLLKPSPDAILLEALEADNVPQEVQAYIDRIRGAEGYHLPAAFECKACKWRGEVYEAVIEPFYYHGKPLAMREGDDYKCPKCGNLLLHHVTRMS